VKIIVTDLPPVEVLSVEDTNKTKLSKMSKQLLDLVDSKHAKYMGRAVVRDNGDVYQIFQLDGKQILIEDAPAREVLLSLADQDGGIREISIK
jgi:hypothetical protein